MKDEIRRIMNLVKEGKLSPEDAAELVEAFQDGDENLKQEEKVAAGASAGTADSGSASTGSSSSAGSAKTDNPVSSFLGFVEGLAKDVTKDIDWTKVNSQVREGVTKGVEAVKKAAEEAKLGQGIGFLFGIHESKVVSLPLSVPEGKVLRIEASSGAVSLVGSTELGQVRVHAGFKAANQEEAKRKAALYTPVLEENEQYVTLKLQEGPDSQIDASINVAPNTPVEIKSSSGRVVVRDMTASVKVVAQSAGFEGTGLKGAVDVSLATGSSRLVDCDGPFVTLESKSGDMDLKRVKGVVTARSSSGDIHLAECAVRTLNIDVASGEVEVDLNQPVMGSVSVRAVSGDVRLSVPDGCEALVNLSTLQGDIVSDIELEDQQEITGKLSGRLGSGSGQIDLSTVSGDVTLSLRNSASVSSTPNEEPAAPPAEPQAPTEG